MIQYNRANGSISLLNDGSSAWTPATLGSSNTLQNSQCAISLAGSSASLSGNTLTLNLATTFKPAYAGAKNIYMYAANGSSVNSAWQQRGTWTVPTGTTTPPPAPPPPAPTVGITADSATPSSGSGTTQTFALQYSDGAGATDLANVWVWFTAAFGGSSSNSCMLYYNRPTGTLNLLSDGSMWMQGARGRRSTVQNSQCAANLAGSSATLSGNTLTLNLAMTFRPSYAGTKTIYMFGQSASGVSSGWQSRGSWTIPAGGNQTIVAADAATPNAGSGTTETFALQYSDSAGATDSVNRLGVVQREPQFDGKLFVHALLRTRVGQALSAG
jgi:hypothetical protein